VVKMSGSITVFTGPMFSGKTEAAYDAGARAKIAGLAVQVIRPLTDTRRGGKAVTKGGRRLEDYGLSDTVVDPITSIAHAIRATTRVLIVDEAQFFQRFTYVAGGHSYALTRDLVESKLRAQMRVYVAGLDMDYLGRGFGPMPELMSVADDVHKRKAVCACGREDAMYTRRLVDDTNQILVGDDEYTPQCAGCYVKGTTDAKQ
jgi:thymidine kinase